MSDQNDGHVYEMLEARPQDRHPKGLQLSARASDGEETLFRMGDVSVRVTLASLWVMHDTLSKDEPAAGVRVAAADAARPDEAERTGWVQLVCGRGGALEGDVRVGIGLELVPVAAAVGSVSRAQLRDACARALAHIKGAAGQPAN
jgi:hypothetical protein